MSQPTIDPMEKTKNAIECNRRQIAMIEIAIAEAQSTEQESKNQLEERYRLLEELDRLDTIYSTWLASQEVAENDELIAFQQEFNDEIQPNEIKISKKPSWMTSNPNEQSWLPNTIKKICTQCHFKWDTVAAASNICSLCNGHLLTAEY